MPRDLRHVQDPLGRASTARAWDMAYYRRFGLCHGEVQARGAIQGYFRRRLARVTVREAIDVRLRALDVVLGRVPPQTEEWLEADARLADSTSTAWDMRAHLSCPVPAC